MKTIPVEMIPKAHPKIRVRDWLSPLVYRLHRGEQYSDGNRAIRFSVRERMGTEREENCIFLWNGMQIEYDLVCQTYQIPVLTEFATYALACASVEVFAEMEITEVTRRGERADYWLGDQELLLEVSGQQEGNLLTLHTEKAHQLLENPFEKDGYVCVANYDRGIARFWYHEYESR